jgi:hypothetical protein
MSNDVSEAIPKLPDLGEPRLELIELSAWASPDGPEPKATGTAPAHLRSGLLQNSRPAVTELFGRRRERTRWRLCSASGRALRRIGSSSGSGY